MKHYFNPMSRGATTAWMLAELDVPHEQVVVDFSGDELGSAEYRAINPIGKLPALVDDGVVVTETAAICAYLADKFMDRGFAPRTDSTERARYYRYLFFPGNTLEPLLTLSALGFVHPNPASAGWGDMPRAMATVESMTPESDSALGAHFTAADVVFGGTLDFTINLFGAEASPRWPPMSSASGQGQPIKQRTPASETDRAVGASALAGASAEAHADRRRAHA